MGLIVIALTVCLYIGSTLAQTDADIEKLLNNGCDVGSNSNHFLAYGSDCEAAGNPCDFPNTACYDDGVNWLCEKMPPQCEKVVGGGITTTPPTTTVRTTPSPTTTTSATTRQPDTTTKPVTTGQTTPAPGVTTKPTQAVTTPPSAGPTGPTQGVTITTPAPFTQTPQAPGTGPTVAPGTDAAGTKSPPIGGAGRDWHTSCCKWASQGQCNSNVVFMRTHCQKSCGTHNCKAEAADKCVVAVKACDSTAATGSNGNTNTGSGVVVPGTGVTTGPSNNAQCSDSNANCATWATMGECTKNPYYMQIKCRKSCNSCTATYASIAGLNYTPTCRDNEDLCPFWASKNECSANSRYMVNMCRAACKTCS